jgi:hypothetical protein
VLKRLIVRTGLKTLLLACISSLSCPALAADNLLRNPSFEQPMDPTSWTCDMAADWIRWGHWMNRETRWVPTHSGDCLIGYRHWQITGTENSGLAQDVLKTEAGRIYDFQIYSFSDHDTNAETISLRLEALKAGVALTTRVYKVESVPVGKWMPLTVSAKAPEGGMRVVILVEPRLKADRKGAIKFDDASLIPEE